MSGGHIHLGPCFPGFGRQWYHYRQRKLSTDLSSGFAFVNTATISAPNDSNSANNSSSALVGGRKAFLPLIMHQWPPTPKPTLNSISNDHGYGNYSVSNAADRATGYDLIECFDDSTATTQPWSMAAVGLHGRPVARRLVRTTTGCERSTHGE